MRSNASATVQFMMRSDNYQLGEVNDGVMPNTWNYWMNQYGDGPYMILRQNYGTVWNSNVAFGNGPMARFVLGGVSVPLTSLPTTYLIGQVAEFICYRRALTDNEKLAVSNYLAAKWAI
jgi:hypothetical protein